MPQLEELIQKKKAKIPHSQIDKFRELQKYISRTDPGKLRLKDTHTKMKTIAQNIRHPELFVPRTDEPAPNETEQICKEEEIPSAMNQQLSPASSDQEFDKHQQDTNEFVSDQKPEPDILDMPDLEHGACDIDSDEDEPPELMTRENMDSSNDDSEDDKNEEDANTRDTGKFDDTMTPEMNILQDMEKAEKLIDQEIQEISDIHPHTPHVKTTSERPNAPHSEHDLDMLASKQPMIGMERPNTQPAGKPKEKRKDEKPKTAEKPKLTHPKSIQDPKNDVEGVPKTPIQLVKKMGIPRRPKSGLERSTGKLAGTIKKNPKETPNSTVATKDTKAMHSALQNVKTTGTGRNPSPLLQKPMGSQRAASRGPPEN
jgi:hypothetical protein